MGTGVGLRPEDKKGVLILLILLTSVAINCTPEPPAPTMTVPPPTPIPSPEPTATPSPTATITLLPTATATPLPTPTPLSPPTVEVEPLPVRQGSIAVLRLRGGDLWAADGSFQGQAIKFVRGAGSFWAIVAVSPVSPPGQHQVIVRGHRTQGAEFQATVPLTVTEASFVVDSVELPPDRVELLDPAVVEEERRKLSQVFARPAGDKQWRGTFIMPVVGEVTSPFGARRSYNGSPPTGYHEGLDLGAPEGEEVTAANGGVVALARSLKVRGNAVIIDHGVNVFSGYYHLSQVTVTEGQQVKRGEVIGRVGETGLATGPHLHWEMRIGEVFVKPEDWLEREIGE